AHTQSEKRMKRSSKEVMSEERRGSSGQTARTNIEQVVELEEEAERRDSLINKWSEKAGAFAGTLPFIAIHALIVIVWVVLNEGAAGSFFVFDPFPYYLLAALFSFESVLLTSFVLIRQTRMSQRADRRGHLDLQINLLAEKEMTKVAQDAPVDLPSIGRGGGSFGSAGAEQRMLS